MITECIYSEARYKYSTRDYEKAIELFKSIPTYKNSKNMLEMLAEIEEKQRNDDKDRILYSCTATIKSISISDILFPEHKKSNDLISLLESALKELSKIKGWKYADKLIKSGKRKIKIIEMTKSFSN